MANLITILLTDYLHLTISPIITFSLTLIVWMAITYLIFLFLSIIVRKLCHRIPGEIDDVILSIFTKPFIVSMIVYGILQSSYAFVLSQKLYYWINRISMTAFILIGCYILQKIIKDIVIRYGQAWANRTDSRVDDILVPIVNIFGNLVLFLFSLFFIMSYWGINLSSILLSAGLAGLVIGLALQDTLSNIFSGINLIVDAPFKIGDLIMLSDGKVCKVEKFGLRATQLYYLDQHATIYVPNKELSNSILTNITKPTVDIKISIEIGVGVKSNLYQVKEILELIANSHPNVLSSFLHIDKKIQLIQQRAELTKDDFLKHVLKKLIAEKSLFQSIDQLMDDLRILIKTIRELEKNGIDRKEKKILEEVSQPLNRLVDETYTLLENWADTPDPWILKEAEIKAQRDRYINLGLNLKEKWEKLKRHFVYLNAEQEMILDNMTEDYLKWLKDDFKQIIAPFKDPVVSFKSFGASAIILSLDFYIDDIRLEHYGRKNRVIREIAFEINDKFKEAGIEIPFNQLDLWIKSNKGEN